MSPLTDWIREVETVVVDVDDPTAAVSPPTVGRRRHRPWAWAVLAGICVVGCGPTAWVTLGRPAETGPAVTRPAAFVTFADAVKHYRISYPRGWQKTTEADGG